MPLKYRGILMDILFVLERNEAKAPCSFSNTCAAIISWRTAAHGGHL